MTTVKIGNVEILPLVDSLLLGDIDQFMPDWAADFRAQYSDQLDERGLIQMSVTCFLVRSEGKTMLVDTGMGNRRRPGFPRGKLDQSLAAAGVAPEDIDVVLNTHLHIDHVGWNTVDDGEGGQRIFFPNAEFWVQRQEWDYWMTPEHLSGEGNAHLVECVEPLRNSDRLKLVEVEQAITKDLMFVPAPGHTPGHVAVGIASAGERGVIIGDASHHPVQLEHSDWSPSFDVDGKQGAHTREALFERAIAEDWLWMAGHWASGIGRIVRLDGRRVFQAL